MTTLHPVLERARQAADRPDELHRLVDWPLSMVGAWARAVIGATLEPKRLALIVTSGLAELDAADQRIDVVRPELDRVCALLKAAELRPASPAETQAALGMVAVPELPGAPDPAPAHLAMWRARAARVHDVWVAEVPGQPDNRLALAPEGDRIVIVQNR